MTNEERQECMDTLDMLCKAYEEHVVRLDSEDEKNIRKIQIALGKSGDEKLTIKEAVKILSNDGTEGAPEKLGYFVPGEYEKAFQKAFSMAKEALEEKLRKSGVGCYECKYVNESMDNEPCYSCSYRRRSHWEPESTENTTEDSK